MQLFFSPQIVPREISPHTGRRLQVFVLFNGKEATTAALRKAAAFVSGLGGEILIAAIQIVPYPLPLDRPPVDRDVLLAEIAGSLAESGIGGETPPKVLIVHARDAASGWRAILPPHCIVIVGCPKRSPLQHLRSWSAAKSLRKRGLEVLLA